MSIHFSFISVISLSAGIIVGMFAQKSRMCFIGGWRDFFLIRDTYLLKGFISFFLTAAILFFAFYSCGAYLKSYPWFARMNDERATMTEEYKQFYDAGFFEVMFMDEKLVHDPNSCDVIAFPDVDFYSEARVPSLTIGRMHIPYQLIFILAAGFLIGLFSTLANGCPMRQHVMAGSGNLSALMYLLGFYAAVLIYESYVFPVLEPYM